MARESTTPPVDAVALACVPPTSDRTADMVSRFQEGGDPEWCWCKSQVGIDLCRGGNHDPLDPVVLPMTAKVTRAARSTGTPNAAVVKSVEPTAYQNACST